MTADLSAAAIDALCQLRRPASDYTRPGLCLASTLDPAVVSELVDAGLIQRGGDPVPVPAPIAALYPVAMMNHAHIVSARIAQGLDTPRDDPGVLSLTAAGWAWPEGSPV